MYCLKYKPVEAQKKLRIMDTPVLPASLIYSILSVFIPPQVNTILVSKDVYNKVFEKMVQSVRRIQRFTRVHVPYDQIPEENFNHKFLVAHSKGIVVRMYMREYPLIHLQRFPELLINKTQKHHLQKWVNTHLQTSPTLRKKSDIRTFFQLPEVTFNDIALTGW